MSKDCPPPRETNPSPARPPAYRFDDQDRAKAAEARKRQYVETAATCNACHAQASCKSFQWGAVCALEPIFKRLPTRDTMDVIAKLKDIIAAAEERTWKNLYFENLDGGQADKTVTAMVNELIAFHLLLARLYQELSPGCETITLEPGTVLGDIFGPRR